MDLISFSFLLSWGHQQNQTSRALGGICKQETNTEKIKNGNYLGVSW